MTLDKHLSAVAAVVGLATLAVLAWVNWDVQPDESGGLVPFLVTAGVALVVWTALFGWYVPRAQRPAQAGVVAGLFGLVSLAAFWSGLPLLLGAGGIVLGSRGRDTSPRAALAAVVLGALAIALAVGAIAYDRTT